MTALPMPSPHESLREEVMGKLASIRREIQTGRHGSPLAKLCTRMVSTTEAIAAIEEAEASEI